MYKALLKRGMSTERAVKIAQARTALQSIVNSIMFILQNIQTQLYAYHNNEVGWIWINEIDKASRFTNEEDPCDIGKNNFPSEQIQVVSV
jgi:hypothetical protein